MLNDFINYIIDPENYKWIFSGIGVAGVITLISCSWYFVKKKKTSSSSNKVTQKNISAGGDVVGRDKNG